MEYTIRRYTPELRDQVVELLTHLWSPQVEVNDRGFAWKYERNPYLREPLVYVALCAGRVVAMRGAFGVRWVAGRNGRVLRAVGIGDMVVDPEHRNRGLYRRVDGVMVTDLGAMGFEYLVNTSLSRVARHVLTTAGWSATPFIRPLARQGGGGRLRRAVSRVAARVLPRSALRAGAERDILGELVRRTNASNRASPPRGTPGGISASQPLATPDGISISNEPRVAQLAAVAAARPAPGQERRPSAPVTEAQPSVDTVRHAKGADFFAWRFGNPLCSYAYAYHESGQGLDGYAVLQTHTDRLDPAVNVVDWEAANPAVLRRLLASVCRSLPGVTISVWPDASNAAADSAMREAGFEPIPDPLPQWTLPSFALHSIGAAADRDPWLVEGKSLLRLESWSLRMIASDFY